MKADFDVIVVGAGPGGSNATAVALANGFRVAQIEKQRFPREKPCAGGLTPKSLAALQTTAKPFFCQTFNSLEINRWQKRINRLSSSSAILLMVNRSEFDSWLVKQNLAYENFSFFEGEKVKDIQYQGNVFRVFTSLEINRWQKRINRLSSSSAILLMVNRSEFDSWLVKQNLAYENFSFFEGEKVKDIQYQGNVFRVFTSKRAITGFQLVGADGAGSIVNRIFKISRPRFSLAFQVNLSKDEVTVERKPLPCLDFGFIPQGCAGVFPKGDYWSVVLYFFNRASIKNVQLEMREYIKAKGFHAKGNPLASLRGRVIAVGGFRLSPPQAPVYLVGDAAGFAEAIAGEGIYYALESGRIAGQVLADVLQGKGSLREYYQRLWPTILLDTRSLSAYW